MGGSAWVTLATNDSYSLGALVLAHSLKQANTKQQLAVLITPGVTNAMREKLATVFNVVQEVDILDSKDEANLRLLKRPELGITFTKLHCWRLTQFDKCVFLDADTLVLENCDELFEREELSAAPDVGWPDCFNSGVFVYKPDNETYEKLVKFALEKGSFDGGDQGLLNLYFSDWAHKDISKHLPFIYNMCSTACYSYLPAYKQFGKQAKIIHFIGASKPWLQYFDTESRRVQPGGENQHLQEVLQKWWDIFCSLIHPQLSAQMPRSSSMVEPSQSYQPPANLSPPESSSQSVQCVWDPWEEYDLKRKSSIIHTDHSSNLESQIISTTEPVESHNTNVQQHYDAEHHQQIPDSKISQIESSSNENHVPITPTYINSQPLPPSSAELPDPTPVPVIQLTPTTEPVPHDPIECQSTPTDCSGNTPLPLESCRLDEEDSNAGLAGAFAQLTLGVPRTPDQTILDDHLRRQGWEVGNIDYLGRDSFANIWSKICETISTTDEPQPADTPVAVPEEVADQQPASSAPAEAVAEPAPEVQAQIVPIIPEVPAPVTEVAVEAKEEEGPAIAVQETKIESAALPAQEAKPSLEEVPVCPLPPKETKPSTEEVQVSPLQLKEIKPATEELQVCSLSSKEVKPATEEVQVCPLQLKETKPATEEVQVCPLSSKEIKLAAEEVQVCPLPAKEEEKAPAKEVTACPLPQKKEVKAPAEVTACPLSTKEEAKPATQVATGPLSPKEKPKLPTEEVVACPLPQKDEVKVSTEVSKEEFKVTEVVQAQTCSIPTKEVKPSETPKEVSKTAEALVVQAPVVPKEEVVAESTKEQVKPVVVPETPEEAPKQEPKAPEAPVKEESKPTDTSAAAPACPVSPKEETKTPEKPVSAVAAPEEGTPTPPPRRGSGPKKGGKSKK